MLGIALLGAYPKTLMRVVTATNTKVVQTKVEHLLDVLLVDCGQTV
jgi:hypothetical protein